MKKTEKVFELVKTIWPNEKFTSIEIKSLSIGINGQVMQSDKNIPGYSFLWAFTGSEYVLSVYHNKKNYLIK